MTETPRLAVVLVNYNNEEDTVACLDCLGDQSLDDFLTIVVDNASEPGSFAQIKNAFDFPIYLQNETNRGFTGGNNAGIRKALDVGVEWILLLNNDTEIEPTFLEEFLASAETLPDDVGIVGPKIHTYESGDIWSAGGTVSKWTANTGSLHETDHEVDQLVDVNLVAGAALLVRNEVFSDIGLLDDDFFIYYEETEFCARARHADWSIMYLPVEGVYHKETTTHTYSSFGEYYLIRNRWLFQQKTKPPYVRAVFYPYYLIRWVIVQVLYLLLVERDTAVAAATFKGGTDAVRGTTGRQHSKQRTYGE